MVLHVEACRETGTSVAGTAAGGTDAWTRRHARGVGRLDEHHGGEGGGMEEAEGGMDGGEPRSWGEDVLGENGGSSGHVCCDGSSGRGSSGSRIGMCGRIRFGGSGGGSEFVGPFASPGSATRTGSGGVGADDRGGRGSHTHLGHGGNVPRREDAQSRDPGRCGRGHGTLHERGVELGSGCVRGTGRSSRTGNDQGVPPRHATLLRGRGNSRRNHQIGGGD